MAKANAQYKTQELSDLRKTIADKREALRALRFEAAGSRSRNVRQGRELRKEIARIITELREREIAEIASKAKTA